MIREFQSEYGEAQRRTIETMPIWQRLHFAYPALTRRQLEVANWLAHGKSNEAISSILGIGIDAVKAHVSAVPEKLAVEDRLGVVLAGQSAPPFEALPPLWSLPGGAWSAMGKQNGDDA